MDGRKKKNKSFALLKTRSLQKIGERERERERER